MEEQLNELNAPQREATVHLNGAMLVLAGAGSGKTRVLTHRIARLIHLGIKPWNILSVTFTNKAAKEMRERVVGLVGETGNSVWLRTFHSACVRILRRDLDKMGYSSSFNIYDSDDQVRLMKAVLQENDWIPKKIGGVQVRPKTLSKRYLRLIDNAKLQPRRFDQLCSYIQENGDFIQNNKVEPVDVFTTYYERLKIANAIDFNDIINMTIHLWEDHPDVLNYWRKKFQYIMVDEYQDTNPAQYQLLRLLAGEHRNIMVVGDDDQSIYAFRGADIQNVNNFLKDFEAKVVRLEQNYRSFGNVINSANAIIKRNPDRLPKKMWTNAEEGPLIESIEPSRRVPFPDERWEAKEVCKYIKYYLDSGRKLSDIAIIYRTNASALVFEKAIRENRFDYEMIGSFKFYDRQEVKNTLSYVKLLVNPYDEISFVRAITTPKRGIGPKSLQQIKEIAYQEDISYVLAAYEWGNRGKGKAKQAAQEFAQSVSNMYSLAQEVPPQELMETLLATVGYTDFIQQQIDLMESDLQLLDTKGRPFVSEGGRRITRMDTIEALEQLRFRWDNVQQIIKEMQQYFVENNEPSSPLEEWLYGYLDFVALNSAADKADGRFKDAVTLLTAHLAKGLEFPIVFVTGLWQGNFPHMRSLQEVKGIEEERRLVYVALTRAKEQLILSRPGRVPSGQDGFVNAEASIFWNEIPPELFKSHQKQQKQKEQFAWLTPTKNHIPKPKPMSRNFDETYSTKQVESLEELQVDIEVLHHHFGSGTIIERSSSLNGLQITVYFDKRGKNILFRTQQLGQLSEIIIR